MGNYRNFKLVVYFVAHGTARITEEELESQLAFFEKHLRIDKVYLEPYRSGEFASPEQVDMCKGVFSRHGIEISGGLTTTFPHREGMVYKARLFNTYCYNDPEMTSVLKEVCAYLGKNYDEFIIDDFFFTNCTCDKCRSERDRFNAQHGITDGSWEQYRLDLMRRTSEELVIASARAENPDIKITIKYPNWAESYQETGYNPAEQRKLFDNIYTGTETRDPNGTSQHLPRYLSFSLMTYMENMWPGHNNGGWFDSFDMRITEHYLEQAYLTAFSKPREMMMFCFQSLVNTMSVPALGFQLDRIDSVLDHTGNPVGVMCYLPDNCRGEDNLQDFLGMCGLPVMCTPYFPDDAKMILLTRSSACDHDIVEKLEKYVAEGGKALVTYGFIKATSDRGIYGLTSVRDADRRITARDFLTDQKCPDEGMCVLDMVRGGSDITFPVPEFSNNSAWGLIKAAKGQENCAVLLRDTYGKGELLTFSAPDVFSSLYKLPAEVIGRLREEFPVNGVWFEGDPLTSIFIYDNDTFIIYRYVDEGVFASNIKIHISGGAKALEVPVINCGANGLDKTVNSTMLSPLYEKNGETVFEWRAVPGEYSVFKIVRG